MIKKKRLIFFLIFILLNNCSFDSKTGIWSGSEKEKRKISEIENEQKQIIDINKIYSSENAFSREVLLARSIVLSKPKKNSSWEVPGLNNQNYLGNIYLPNAKNIFFKKKIGKNKFSTSKIMTTLLMSKNNIISSDDTGTIFNIRDDGKINWKINIYKKLYKKIYKNLVYSIYKNTIYIADNIGFIYSVNLKTGKIVWIKNYGVPLKSTIKVFNDKLFLTDQDNRIICLNTNDGSKIWDIVSISSFIKSQNLLSLAVTKNGDLISINSAADIFKIKGNTGEIYWSRNTSDSLFAHDLDFFISSDIVIAENEIIFSAGNSIFSYDIDNGNINWQNEVSSVGSPIVDKENIFLVSENGYFVVLDRDSGKIISSTNILKILKRKRQLTKITGFVMGSGKIYAVTLNGYLVVSSVFSGKVEYFKKIGDPIISAPIISNGKLYIITENSRIVGLN